MAKEERTQYNAKVLQKYVDELYARARAVIFTTALKYGVISLVVAFIGMRVFFLLAHEPDTGSNVLPIGIAVVGLIAGVAIGNDKAWDYKFQAQKLLLQMQIERNTRAVQAATDARATASAQTV